MRASVMQLLLGALAVGVPRLLLAEPFNRDSAVQSLAVLGSHAAPNGTCLGVLVGSTALVAPAHCVAQSDAQGQSLEWAAFGFSMVSLPPDSINVGVSWPTRGEFRERERIRVTATTLHPDFDARAWSSERFADHDWAVLQLERAPTAVTKGDNTAHPITPLPFLDDSVAELYALPFFGALFVARDSLELTWVDEPRLKNPLATCGLELHSTAPTSAADTSARSSSSSSSVAAAEPVDSDAIIAEPLLPVVPNNVVCATLLRDESLELNTATNASSNSMNRWLGALLLVEHGQSSGYFVAGVGSAHSDAPNTRSFTWAEATGPEFLGKPVFADATWKHVPPSAPLIGYDLPALSASMQFMTGVRMTRKAPNYCGGSLIAPTFVLTAAHCIEAPSTELPWVSIGSLKTEGAEYGEQIRVKRVVVHPAFDVATMANDLALLELAYASVAPPVALFNSQPVPTAGQIFGYGATTTSGTPLSDVLRFVNVDVVASNAQCTRDLQLDIDASMFCAGGQASKDACDGDSGGPLVVTADVETGATALLGVISYGRGCGMQFLPGVYANVSHGHTFIASVVANVMWTAPTQSDNNLVGPTPSSPSPSSLSPSLPTTSDAPTLDPPRTSSPAPTRTPAPPNVTSLAANAFVLPTDLSPSVKSAVVAFLVGDTAQISSAAAVALLERSEQIQFFSSASLAALEQIIMRYNAKTLHQRHARFAKSDMSVC